MHTEFWVNNWVFVIDPTYLSLEGHATAQAPGPSQPTGKVDGEIWIVEARAGYRLSEAWEAIVGVRHHNHDITTDGLPSPPFLDGAGASDSWNDWFVGARFKTDIGGKWFMVLRGDVVVADESEGSWNASVFLNRHIGTHGNMALNLGYRYLVDDYNNNREYRWDVTRDGPVVGFTWVF